MHVDDIVRLLLSSAAHPRNGAIYNAVDDEPAAGHVAITYACSIMNVKPPPLVCAAISFPIQLLSIYYAVSYI